MSAVLLPGLAIAATAASVGSGLVFLSAGLAKLRHRELVRGVVANYRLLPDALVGPVAALLPLAEVAIALVLLGGVGPLAAAPAIVLLLAFAGGMAINLRRGRRHIDCGCGRSQLRQPLSWQLVARNGVLVVLLLPALQPIPAAAGADLVIGLAGGVSLFVLVLLFNSIAALAASPLASARR